MPNIGGINVAIGIDVSKLAKGVEETEKLLKGLESSLAKIKLKNLAAGTPLAGLQRSFSKLNSSVNNLYDDWASLLESFKLTPKDPLKPLINDIEKVRAKLEDAKRGLEMSFGAGELGKLGNLDRMKIENATKRLAEFLSIETEVVKKWNSIKGTKKESIFNYIGGSYPDRKKVIADFEKLLEYLKSPEFKGAREIMKATGASIAGMKVPTMKQLADPKQMKEVLDIMSKTVGVLETFDKEKIKPETFESLTEYTKSSAKAVEVFEERLAQLAVFSPRAKKALEDLKSGMLDISPTEFKKTIDVIVREVRDSLPKSMRKAKKESKESITSIYKDLKNLYALMRRKKKTYIFQQELKEARSTRNALVTEKVQFLKKRV